MKYILIGLGVCIVAVLAVNLKIEMPKTEASNWQHVSSQRDAQVWKFNDGDAVCYVMDNHYGGGISCFKP